MKKTVLAALLLCVSTLAAFPADPDAPADAGPSSPGPGLDPVLAPAHPAVPTDQAADQAADQDSSAAIALGRPGPEPTPSASVSISTVPIALGRARRLRKLRKTTPVDVLEGAESGGVVASRAAVASTTTAPTSTVPLETPTSPAETISSTSAVAFTTASPADATTTSVAPSSPTTLRARSVTTANASTSASSSAIAASTVPYRGRGKFRLPTTSTEFPASPHLGDDHLSPFLNFGRKISSDPTRSPPGSAGSNQIAESSTWGRSVLRRVPTPSSGTAGTLGVAKKGKEEETHEEMDVGFDRQVVEKNKVAARRRDSSRTTENLVILAGGSTPTSVKKASRRKFVVTRKTPLGNSTDSPANVTYLEPVSASGAAWPTPRPTHGPRVDTPLLQAEDMASASVTRIGKDLITPQATQERAMEPPLPTTTASEGRPTEGLDGTLSLRAAKLLAPPLQLSQQSQQPQQPHSVQPEVQGRLPQDSDGDQGQPNVERPPEVQSRRAQSPVPIPEEEQEQRQPNKARLEIQSWRPIERLAEETKVYITQGQSSPSYRKSLEHVTESTLSIRPEDQSKRGQEPVTGPWLGSSAVASATPASLDVPATQSNASDSYANRRFEEPSGEPSAPAFIKPPKSQIPYAFVVGGRSTAAGLDSTDNVNVDTHLSHPSAPDAAQGPEASRRGGDVHDVPLSRASTRPEVVEAVVTSVSVKQPLAATPGPSQVAVAIPSPTVTENLQDVVKIFFNSTPPANDEAPVAVTSAPALPLAAGELSQRTVVRNTSEVSVVLPSSTTSTTTPGPVLAPSSSPRAPRYRSTTTSSTTTPAAARHRSTTGSSVPPAATPTGAVTPSPEAEARTPFIIHVPAQTTQDQETKPRTASTGAPGSLSSIGSWTELTVGSSSTTTTTGRTTRASTTTSTTPSSTTFSTIPTTTNTTTPSSTPQTAVVSEVAAASTTPRARADPNPGLTISPESIRERAFKRVSPVPVAKEVFKNMTTASPVTARPFEQVDVETTTVTSSTTSSTTTTSTTEAPIPSTTRSAPMQPRPSTKPGRMGGGARGRGQAGQGQVDDPLLLDKSRTRAVSKQDFEDAKRVPSDQDVAPGVGVLTYVLLALGVVPLALGGVCTARYFIHRRKKILDESDSSSELSCHRRPRAARADVSPKAKLPRTLPHLLATSSPPKQAWEDGELDSEQREQRGREAEWDRDRPLQMPTPTRWEFPRDKLRLQTLLGQGNFGQVWKAEADDVSGHHGLTRLVAVKTVKEGASVREREDLLRELGIMQQLGAHPNVVTLLGCCTEKEPFLLIMEYVMYGKLLAFLRDHRTRQDYYNFSEDSDALTSRDLTVFAFCVARGMEYLASKGVIHRDLAARNVLVDHNKLCKIADFGMSRSVRESGCGQVYEQRENKGALPIRWMAPESLIYSVFTHKSDVWSFGILMWEIVTLGSTPYPAMGAREVLRRVRDGYRLERPAHCRPELFRIVLRCWNADPAKRPDFGELRRALADLLEDGVRAGSYVDLEGFAMDSNKAAAAAQGGPGSSPPVLLNPLGNAMRDEANI